MTDDELDALIGGLRARGPVPGAPSLDGVDEADRGGVDHPGEALEDDDPELDSLLRGLRPRGPLPPAPALPPALALVPAAGEDPPSAPEDRPTQRPAPRRTALWGGGLALVAAALLAVGVSQRDRRPRVTARGGGAAVSDVVLELAVDRGQGAERLGRGATVTRDDTLYFRLGVQPPGKARLWIVENGVKQTILEQRAGAEPQVVSTAAGVVGYRPEAVGQLVVGVTAGDTEHTVVVDVVDGSRDAPAPPP